MAAFGRGARSIVDSLIDYNPAKRISRTLMPLLLLLQTSIPIAAPIGYDAATLTLGSIGAGFITTDIAINILAGNYNYHLIPDFPVAVSKPIAVTVLTNSAINTDNKDITINQSAMEQLRQKAVDEHFPQLAFTSQGYFEEPYQSVEHPVLKELPKDVLTPEELAVKGIFIIQGTDTQLFIRENAFNSDGPLKYYDGKNGRKLQIVLVDGPVIATRYMNDPKYIHVWNSFSDDFQLHNEAILEKAEEYRNEEIRMIDQHLQILKDDSSILVALANRKWYQEVSAVELADNIDFGDTRSAELYVLPKAEDPTAYIFVVVGTIKQDSSQQIINGFDSQGKLINIRNISGLRNTRVLVKPDQSILNPADYSPDPVADPGDPKSYLYKGFNTSFALEHGLTHDLLINLIGNKGIIPNSSEYKTDQITMARLQVGWSRWVNSGYKDTSGLFILFSLPATNGYIYGLHFLNNLSFAA